MSRLYTHQYRLLEVFLYCFLLQTGHIDAMETILGPEEDNETACMNIEDQNMTGSIHVRLYHNSRFTVHIFKVEGNGPLR